MNKLTFSDIVALIKLEKGDDAIVSLREDLKQPQAVIHTSRLEEVAKMLWEGPSLYFDTLSCLTALDNGEKEGTIEVIYHLYSIPYEHAFVIFGKQLIGMKEKHLICMELNLLVILI
jgi:NADH-quinone oxidoreductase subunit C